MSKRVCTELEILGNACAKYRREVLCVPQRFVAVDVGCSIPNVSQFEKGRNDSAKLLLWYLSQGFKVEKSERVEKYGIS